MGCYSTRIFPWLLDWFMSRESFTNIRREVLAGIGGDTLEIGFGTGLNLPHYPAGTSRITAIDLNPGMGRFARSRSAASRIQVDYRTLNGESLDFPDRAFDSVVCTWTLCSIPDPVRALREVLRVLKQGGRFFFVEHGLSPDASVRRWQHRLTPIQKRVADGCHLNRDIEELLRMAGFTIEKLDTYYLEGLPRVGGFMYQGVAATSETD
jgi:ubiquinone/menaquinone biosynthesis C-methylase UbiE